MHLYLNSVCREIQYLPMALVKEIKGSIKAIFIFLTNRFSQSGHISAKSVEIISNLINK